MAGEDAVLEGEATEDEAGESQTGEAPEGGDSEQQAADWRTQIEDEKLRAHADRFPSLTDLVRGNLTLRQERDRLKNTALVMPGDDAGEDEIKAFREKLGVPESPEGYEFPDPPEGEEVTEFEKQSREQWAQRFHELGVPKDTAAKIAEAWREDMGKATEHVAQQDEAFARETEAALKREWGEDFERNKKIASAAASELFGDDLDDMKQATTRDGRLVLDSVPMMRALGKIGREMQEGSLSALTDDDRSTLEDQANDARKKRQEAMQRGDRDAARRHDEKERELLGRIHSGSIVGTGGRTA